MAQWLAIEDVSAFGLGVDVVGAILLMQGLTPSTLDLIRTSQGMYFGYNPALVSARALDKVRAGVGVALLMAGFSAQALGLVLELGNRDADVADHFHVIAAIAIVGSGALAGLITWRAARGPLLKRELRRVAVFDPETLDEAPAPRPDLLMKLGEPHWPAASNENAEAYSLRVYGIDGQI